MAESNLVQITLRGKDELSGVLRQVQASLDQLGKQQAQSSQQMTQAVTQSTQAWQQFGGVLGSLGIATSIAGIAAATLAFGKSVVDTGVQIEGMRKSLVATSGSIQQGERTFRFLVDTSNKLGVDVLTAANSFKQLQAATRGTVVEGQQTQQLFTAVAGAIKVTGGNSEQLGRALNALQQIISKGTVSSEELRGQLGEALPGAFQIAARSLGITTAELSKMLEQGKLLSTDFIAPFIRQLTQEFGPAVEASTKTAGSAFARLGNEITLAKNEIAESGLLALLTNIANAGADALKARREVSEYRTDLAGGAPLALPPELAQSAEGRRVTEEMAQYRRLVTGRQGLVEGLLFPSREDAAAKLRAILDDQKRLIDQHNARLQAENEDGGGVFRAIGATTEKQKASEDAIQKLFAAGLKDLDRIALNAPFLSSLELAEEKLKSWEKTLKSIRDEFDKLAPSVRDQIGTSAGPTSRWSSLIGPLAASRNIPPQLIEALVAQESGGDPRAESRAGAKGLGQFMPATAAQYGIAGREFDPGSNLRATVNYLADLLKMFGGDIRKALTAYNAGPRGGGIPQASGENATFAQDVLRRIPGGLAGLTTGQAMGQGTSLQAAVDAEKRRQSQMQEYVQQELQDTEARIRTQAELAAQQTRNEEAALVRLARIQAGLTQTKEARLADTAAAIAAEFPQNALIQQAASVVTALAETRDAYNAEAEALKESFTAFKQRTDAAAAAEDAQAAFNKQIADTLRLLDTPRTERASERLRQNAPGGITTPQQDLELRMVDAKSRALAQQREIEDMARDLARGIEGTFTGMWENVFSGGVTSFQSFAALSLQSIQRVLGQATSQLISQLLGRAIGGQNNTGGIGGALTNILVSLGTSLVGGGGNLAINPGSVPTNWSVVAAAKGGIVPALQSVRDVGFRQRAMFRGMQPLAFASGGVVTQPSFAMIGEGGQNEAVVPLPDGRSIPVAMTGNGGSQRAAQPVVIEMHTSFVDPATQKTTRQEVRNWVIDDIASDGQMRRVIQQHAR